MVKDARSRMIALMLIFSFILFYSPYFLTAETEGKGNLFGIIYDKEEVAQVEGVIVKIRNVATGIVYVSSKTDKLGTFKIEGIDEGFYVAGVSTEKGDFSLENLVEIKANETHKIFIAFTAQLELVEINPEVEWKGKGNLIGTIYDKDEVTPVEGAIVKIRNVATEIVYVSSKTDKLGTFGIEDIEEGLYSVGIFTEDGNFNVESLVGINTNEVVVITFALKPYSIGEAKKAEVKANVVKKEKPISKSMKFFASPVGIATILATNAVISYGIVKLTEKEEEVSPIK